MVYRNLCTQVRQRLLQVTLHRRRNFLYAIEWQRVSSRGKILFSHFQISISEAIEDVEDWMGENKAYDDGSASAALEPYFLLPGPSPT